MKDSGVEWIGSIPRDWTIVTSKNILVKNDGGVWGNDQTGIDDTIVLRSTEQDVEGRLVLLDPAYRALGYVEKKRALLCCGDIIITKSSGSSDHIGKASLVNETIEEIGCCFSNFLQRIKVDGCPEYFWYLYNFNIARDQYRYLSTTTTGLNNITAKTIGSIILPHPRLSEQVIIAKYLNEECTKIDRLISLQEEMIAELQAYKQSVITEAVTKGLDPNVPMKESAVKGIGNIPIQWSIGRLKYYVWFNPNNELPVSEDSMVSYAPMECVGRGQLISREIDYGGVKTGYSFFQDGDIILAKVTPCFENGNIAIAENLVQGIGYGSSELFVLRPMSIDRKWLFYYLQNSVFKQNAQATMMGTGGLKRVSPQFVISHKLAIPPKTYQKEIASYLDIECKKIDRLISLKQSKIDSLKEYKKSLIYECVTGKREVV